jgi:hypothetical protein
LRILNRANTSIDASSTVSKSGNFGSKYGMRGESIDGVEPSAQNSGFRRFCNLTTEFLLFLRAELKDVDDDDDDGTLELPALLDPALLEFSSTGR